MILISYSYINAPYHELFKILYIQSTVYTTYIPTSIFNYYWNYPYSTQNARVPVLTAMRNGRLLCEYYSKKLNKQVILNKQRLTEYMLKNYVYECVRVIIDIVIALQHYQYFIFS